MARTPVTVTQLNNYLRDSMKSDIFLNGIRVTGEITGLKYHSSGHVFFSIKDAASVIECNLWASVLPRIRYRLEDGMQIIATGNVDFYPKNGRVKLIVSNVEVEGEGDLAVAFEKMKIKLDAEGLFAADHKKPLPSFPKKIAVVTAPDGAAVKDIIKTITQKNDYVDIVIWPVSVQGEGSADSIANGIIGVNKHLSDTDIIICGRGGGSKEDLWSFNEEIVARAIYDSEIPVISAVGHEIDISISDLVADARAATPTAAGEMAVPNTFEIRDALERNAEDLTSLLERYVQRREDLVRAKDPAHAVYALSQRIERHYSDTAGMKTRIENRIDMLYEKLLSDISIKKAGLEAMGPAAVLDRGYAIVKDAAGGVVTRTEQVEKGDEIIVSMSDGALSATVTGKGD